MGNCGTFIHMFCCICMLSRTTVAGGHIAQCCIVLKFTRYRAIVRDRAALATDHAAPSVDHPSIVITTRVHKSQTTAADSGPPLFRRHRKVARSRVTHVCDVKGQVLTKQRPGVRLLVRQLADISHGSVATRSRCGGMFNDDFIGNLLSV